MTRFRVVPERSQLWIEAKSSLHPIHGQAERLEGEAEVRLNDSQLDLSEPPKGRITLPVERLSSGNALQDQEMRRRLDPRKFPMITAELRDVKALEQPNRYRVQSDLTFHGITRRLPATVTVNLDQDRTLRVAGDLVLDVRAFGVTPPSLLGLKVDPEVKVRLDMVLAP